jgi:endonuclease/exonuclease/phosphatase family metal-dependent hydrolase
MLKLLKWLIGTLIIIALSIAVLVYALTFHPKPVQPASLTCPSNAPVYSEQSALKVVSYNVQYFAGKDYVFFYDLLDNSGPDTRPSAESIEQTVEGIANILIDSDADVLLLQELHENHISTDYQNQTELLLAKLGDRYPCYSEAFYWKAGFVPIPEIMGSVGMKLVTLSKYKIEEAERHQLSLIPSDPITQAFNLKRAVLTTQLPTVEGEPWTLMNTHLDAFSQGTDTMMRQVEEVAAIIEQVDARPWIIAGDYNLLAEGQYEKLTEKHRAYYNPQTELAVLHAHYPSIPSLENIQGERSEDWYTHYPNDPSASGPDRTIDYIFYSPLLTTEYEKVLQGKALTLSDHLPIIGNFKRAD